MKQAGRDKETERDLKRHTERGKRQEDIRRHTEIETQRDKEKLREERDTEG